MKKQYVQEIKTYGGGSSIRVANASHPDQVACLAADIATRFALVAAMPDGEDSAGRQKLRLPTAEELAARSCDIAAALFDQFDKRGMLLDLPAPRLAKGEVLASEVDQPALLDD